MSPGLTLTTAPCLEPLFEVLAERTAAAPLPPLLRETVLVAQNRGLRRWLELAVARRDGCAAALDLRSPLDFSAALARQLLPALGAARGEQHPFHAAPLAWRLVPLLADLPEDDPVYAPLRAYLRRTDGAVMPLAARLAALFDDYQVYRPEVLAAWAAGRDPRPDFPHGAWQAALWRQLVAGTDTADRATTLAALVRRLEDGAVPEGVLPPRIAVFGALLFPPALYRVLVAAARHVPVALYSVTAGAEPRTEPFRHPLLRALAGRTCDFWTVMRDLGVPEPTRLGAPPPAGPPAAWPALRQLQHALAHDASPAAPVPLDPADRSIRVLDCHSEVRELEALRDALLDAFDALDGLRPSDVLVLLPDLDRYAPLVDAVFGAESVGGGDGAAGALRIPYHVVGHPHAPAQRVLDAFRKALRLHDGRVAASELLDLLHHPAVCRRAGIREDELPTLRAWVREAGVCWGLTAQRKTRFDLPDCDLHTWRFGLDRLLLGVAAGGEGGLLLGHLPCDAAGLEGADLLGRFAEWAEALFDALHRLDRERRLEDWPDAILLFLEGFIDAREDEELEAVVFLRERVAELARLYGSMREDAAVPFRAVRAHLDAAAAFFEGREPFLTGRVTFAPPLALRHAPHRVVAVLGLNDGAFPQAETPPGFDLVAQEPRPGDPAVRRTEKQLFVDAVLAARERLVLSYVGRSQKDNAERAASVALDALLDAAERHWGPEAPERLTVRHRLQPFAEEYFAPGSAVHSFAAQHLARLTAGGLEAAPFLDGRPLPEAEPPREVPLDALAAAWTSPSRFVLRQRLRVSLDLDEAAATDDEPVTLDGLSAYTVRQAVLEALLDGLTDGEVAARLLRSGMLPAGAPGAVWLRQSAEAVRPVAARVRAFGATAPRPLAVEVDATALVGAAERVGAGGALRFRAGRVREKDLVAAWVHHLALCAAGDPLPTAVLGTEGSCVLDPVEAEDARHLLASLLLGFRRAARGPLPLYERASYAYAAKLSGTDRAGFTRRILDRQRHGAADGLPFHAGTAAMKAARSAFDPFGAPGDRGDAYVALATRGRDPFWPEEAFAKWALCLWAPLLHYRREGDGA